MITINIDPVILSIGHFMIRWYSVILTLAVAVGVWVASREAQRKGLDEGRFGDAVMWVIAGGVIGARLFHVIDHWPDEFAANPIRVLYIWEGGLAIWGAVVGGFATLAVLARCQGLSLGLLADIAAPGLVLGQAIGRAACVITGDAVGKATAGPFGFAYVNRGAMVPEYRVYYTPSPVYELLMNLGIFVVIWRLRARNWPDGVLFLVYLLLYASGRFVVTFWSAYQIVVFGLNQAQLVSLGALAVGLPALVLLLSRSRRLPSMA